MFFNLKKNNPLLDEESIDWMFETYAWALTNFGIEAFNASHLVNPSNDYFPGRANSAEEMASMIFNSVVEHAGMKHWPFKLVNEEDVANLSASPQKLIEGPLRIFNDKAQLSVSDNNALLVTYHPYQLNDPEVLIGSYAHALAHYIGTQAKETPPGGQENWPHITELLAVFLGFGVIMANSAYTNKVRSCGSCAGPIVERMNFLSQYDLTYALAIFTNLKNIPNKHVLPFLKKSLHPFYKKSMKDIYRHESQLNFLRENLG